MQVELQIKVEELLLFRMKLALLVFLRLEELLPQIGTEEAVAQAVEALVIHRLGHTQLVALAAHEEPMVVMVKVAEIILREKAARVKVMVPQ